MLSKPIQLGDWWNGLRNSVSSRVVLFKVGSPSAIFLKVMTVWVESVYGSIFLPMLRDMKKVRFVHIITEVLKTLPKNLYPSSTILMVTTRRFCITSSPHSMKNSVEASQRHFMSSSIESFMPCTFFSYWNPATTAFLFSACNVVLSYSRFIATRAKKIPIDIIAFSVRKFDSFKQTEYLSSYINRRANTSKIHTSAGASMPAHGIRFEYHDLFPTVTFKNPFSYIVFGFFDSNKIAKLLTGYIDSHNFECSSYKSKLTIII